MNVNAMFWLSVYFLTKSDFNQNPLSFTGTISVRLCLLSTPRKSVHKDIYHVSIIYHITHYTYTPDLV